MFKVKHPKLFSGLESGDHELVMILLDQLSSQDSLSLFFDGDFVKNRWRLDLLKHLIKRVHLWVFSAVIIRSFSLGICTCCMSIWIVCTKARFHTMVIIFIVRLRSEILHRSLMSRCLVLATLRRHLKLEDLQLPFQNQPQGSMKRKFCDWSWNFVLPKQTLSVPKQSKFGNHAVLRTAPNFYKCNLRTIMEIKFWRFVANYVERDATLSL